MKSCVQMKGNRRETYIRPISTIHHRVRDIPPSLHLAEMLSSVASRFSLHVSAPFSVEEAFGHFLSARGEQQERLVAAEAVSWVV